MAGIIPTRARMTTRLTLGYRHAHTTRDSPFGAAGRALRGHEFHYSCVEPSGAGLSSSIGVAPSTWLGPRVFASYLHLHLGGDPGLASEFVARSAVRGVRG